MRRGSLRILASAIIVVVLLVIHLATPTRGGLWLQTFYDSLHVPLFGIIAICVLVATPLHWSRRRRLLTVFGAVVALSVLSEIAQIPSTRDASLSDLLADWFGAAGVVAVAIVFSRSISVPKGRGRYLVIVGVVLIAWPLLPLAKVSAAYLERNQSLPSLVNFNSRIGDAFYYLQNAQLRIVPHAIAESVSAEIVLGNGPWPGIVFHDLWPNWEAYSTLIIRIENPETEAIPINVRVHDRTHREGDQPYLDRFNLHFELPPGEQLIRIELSDVHDAPEDREMNMTQIDGLVIFCKQQEAGRKFRIGEIRLE